MSGVLCLIVVAWPRRVSVLFSFNGVRAMANYRRLTSLFVPMTIILITSNTSIVVRAIMGSVAVQVVAINVPNSSRLHTRSSRRLRVIVNSL